MEVSRQTYPALLSDFSSSDLIFLILGKLDGEPLIGVAKTYISLMRSNSEILQNQIQHMSRYRANCTQNILLLLTRS